MRHINDAGLALIERNEGLRVAAYRDIAGIWTIGYGHTGSDVHAGLVITAERANSIRLHEKHGFRFIGRYEALGYKFDRWLDIVHLQRAL